MNTSLFDTFASLFKSASRRMRIIVIDDHALLLDGIVSLLKSEQELEVAATAESAEVGLKLIEQYLPDLLITDFSLPGMDGLSLIRKVKQQYPEIKIIMLSMYDETHLVKEILRAGVNAYILKKDSHIELISAIKNVAEGKLYLSNDINLMLMQSLHGDEQRLLTDREREILKLIAEEYSNKQIAESLFISERTVESHRKNIFRKTGTNSLVGLIKFAYANNLI